MVRRLIQSISIILLAIAQVSLISTWSLPVSGVNIVLCIVIFLTAIASYYQALWWAFIGGLVLELYSFTFFGITIVGMIVTVMVLNFFYTRLFTHYSFYSLTILGLFGTLSYNILIVIGRIGLALFDLTPWTPTLGGRLLAYIFWEVILNMIVLYVIFFIFHFLIGKFKMSLNDFRQDEFTSRRRT